MDQLNLFDIEVINYPKSREMKLTIVQMEFIINALKIYASKLERVSSEGPTGFIRSREERELEVLIEYLDAKMGGKERLNKRINRAKDEVGVNPFDSLYEGEQINE